MSEMSPEIPDPFVPVEAQEIMTGLHSFYAAAVQAGFPEQRAFELVRDFFVSQMAVVQQMMLGKTEQEG